jgi:hypothetical protein
MRCVSVADQVAGVPLGRVGRVGAGVLLWGSAGRLRGCAASAWSIRWPVCRCGDASVPLEGRVSLHRSL